MSKYTGALCRLCRAERTKLFLKGKRCTSDKCAMERRNYPPGQKGAKIAYKKSNYKVQLREKQKVKRFYGVGEKQFRNVFAKAALTKGITGENLLTRLELRLDNVVYRMNLAASRSQARQLVRHGHLNVNGRKVNIPSFLLSEGDVISLREKSLKNESLQANIESLKGLVDIPSWMVIDEEKKTGKVNTLPTREDVSIEVEEHLIVELYSK